MLQQKQKINKWWTLAIVGAGTFMSALDGSVVNTALPIIQKETSSLVSTAAWIVLVYLLTVSASLLVFGRLGDIHGRKVFYIGGLITFIVGSALSGLSPGIYWLIGFRALQALGAASLFALGPAILTGIFPGSERGRALGMQATATYIGLAAGPTIGGLLTEHLGWRWIFFINVPIGLMVIPIAMRVLRKDGASHTRKFDLAGAIALSVALSALLFGINEGETLGWNSLPVLITLVTAAIALPVFIMVEKRVTHALVNLRLFSNVVFSMSTIAALLSYMATSAVNFLMPFYLETARGFRVDVAGYILVSTPVVMAMLTGWSGALSDRIGQRIPATIGMALTVTGVLLLRTLSPSSSWWIIVPHLALIGVGVGLFTSPNNSAIMGSAPKHSQGVAGAILAAARNIGFVFGTALAVAIYGPRLGSLSHITTAPRAITMAMQDATTVVAIIAAAGIVISAVRGRVRPSEKDH